MSKVLTEKKKIKRVKKGVKILKYANKKNTSIKEAQEKFDKEGNFINELFFRLNRKPYRRPKFTSVPAKLKNKFLKLHTEYNKK